MQNQPVNPPHPFLCPTDAMIRWKIMLTKQPKLLMSFEKCKMIWTFLFQEAPGSNPRPPTPAPAAPSQSPAAGLPSSGTTQGPPNPLGDGPPTPGPTMVGANLPPTGTFSQTVISSGSTGQAPSQEVDACASTAFSGIMVSTDFI